MLTIEREFEDIPLTLDDGAKVGSFAGRAAFAVSYGGEPFVQLIMLGERKLGVNNWGDWAIYKMLSTSLLRAYAEEIDEVYNTHYAAEIAEAEAENSLEAHGRG